jgi:hypothetical protein
VGQVAESNAESERRMPRNDTTEADFDVVRVRPKDEEINGHIE